MLRPQLSAHCKRTPCGLHDDCSRLPLQTTNRMSVERPAAFSPTHPQLSNLHTRLSSAGHSPQNVMHMSSCHAMLCKGCRAYSGCLIRPAGHEASPCGLNADCSSPGAQERPPSRGAAPCGLHHNGAGAYAPELARLHSAPPQRLQLRDHAAQERLPPACRAHSCSPRCETGLLRTFCPRQSQQKRRLHTTHSTQLNAAAVGMWARSNWERQAGFSPGELQRLLGHDALLQHARHCDVVHDPAAFPPTPDACLQHIIMACIRHNHHACYSY